MSVSLEAKKAQSRAAELARQEELLFQIGQLGGQGVKEEDIVYQGDKITLPERWAGDLDSAIDFLTGKAREERQTATFTRTYNYRPLDGAFNAYHAMKKAFGMVMGKTKWSFFGPEPPEYRQINTDVDATEEIPWGTFTVPLLKNTTIDFGEARKPEFGRVFKVTINAPRKARFVIEGLFKLIETELKENSIYRGKAIDGKPDPDFVDVRGHDPAKVVYSDQVEADLNAHVWGPLRYAKESRKQGLPAKRAVLMTGEYGTGKTLAGFTTAQEATANDYTFIMARPGRDNFTEVMQTARLYQPAVVFMEDVDTIAAAANADIISEMLDLFDGIQAKSTELMVVLTTNHPDELHKGMMRPGRLDAIIEINALDASGSAKLFRLLLGDRLDPEVDWDVVGEACEGYAPAFVKEAADRVIRYSLVRGEGKVAETLISTEDLVQAANGLRSQYRRMQGAPEFSDADALEQTLTGLIEKAINKAVPAAVTSLIPNPETASIADQVWNKEEVAKVAKAANGRAG